ncbi:hypothetical protein BD769DRAFT_1388300 [Suillus cothurnatus]|nr:hypothetical protein BD769DRAFT_1388300 [Suillus cothurnatus]
MALKNACIQYGFSWMNFMGTFKISTPDSIHWLKRHLSETEGLHTLVNDMNTKMASAVLATDECCKEMDDLRNIIQGISDEGQTLRKLVMDIKTWIQGSPIIKMLHRNLSIANQTKLNLRLMDLEKQVSKVQNSQGVHGQILCMSVKELGILRSELESSQHDSTHELQHTCSSFWRAMVNEMEDICNRVINEMKDILPCTGNDLHDEIVGSDELQPPDHALLSVGTPACQQLHHGVYLIHGHSFLQNIGDNFQNPCVEAAGVSTTIDCQLLIQTFHSSSSADLEDTCGLLALGKYLGIGILLNITTEDYISYW